VSAVGLLVARHRPALLAAAISLMGHGPDAEDAVQEASVTALCRIGDLRDPGAAGAWLRAVVRNSCRARLRSRAEVPLGADLAAALRAGEPDPAELLDRHAARDWVWAAMEGLPPHLRLTLMLRYFTAVTAYQDIADACGVPVGTVRSRLSDARGRLARALLATAEAAHSDAGKLAVARRRDAEETVAAGQRGELGAAFASFWSPAVEIVQPGGQRITGFDQFVRDLEAGQELGVRTRIANVVASRDLVLWEFTLLSPAADPDHCPPGAAWVLHLSSGLVRQARLVHSRGRSPGYDRAA
jgi:RNA polymerase sigma-70 factor (ECF subfamily)